MRIKVNPLCNVLTDTLSTAYRGSRQAPAPQITVPHLRLRLSIAEATELAECLSAAIVVARREEDRRGSAQTGS